MHRDNEDRIGITHGNLRTLTIPFHVNLKKCKNIGKQFSLHIVFITYY
jgi:hypothetical protein